MQLGQEQDYGMQLTADLTVRGPPSPCFQTVLRLLSAPTRGWGGCTHVTGCGPGPPRPPRCWRGHSVAESQKQSSLELCAKSELISLTQLLGCGQGGPSKPAVLGWEAAVWAVCVLRTRSPRGCQSLPLPPLQHHQPKPAAAGSWGAASQRSKHELPCPLDI